MSRRLFWQLNISFLAVSLILFSSLHHYSYNLTSDLTRISDASQQILLGYASSAERHHKAGDTQAILELVRRIEQELGVWSAVILEDHSLISDRPVPDHLREKLGFQRYVYWPIHHFMSDVLIGIGFEQHGTSFVIELPRSMYSTADTALVHNLLTIVAPSLILSLFCWAFYRHIMRPLEALNQGTLKLASGDLSARVLPEISTKRRDELVQVAIAFDSMADRIERLVNSQRQLLGDLSHELRTPLTRIGLAVELCKKGSEDADRVVPRLEREVEQMHKLVEDALTLAWLDGDPELVSEDRFNLASLLKLVCEDAEFEYPGRTIECDFEDLLPIEGSSQKALSQCIENVVRNALKYSPDSQPIYLLCDRQQSEYLITVSDRGPGVPEASLQKIFKPFYRIDKARSRDMGGFGLGLALCQRQMAVLGGAIKAEINSAKGLDVKLRVPIARETGRIHS